MNISITADALASNERLRNSLPRTHRIAAIDDVEFDPPMAIEHITVAHDVPTDSTTLDLTVWPGNTGWMVGLQFAVSPGLKAYNRISLKEN